MSSSPESDLPNGGAVNPCGLMAWSFFNDTYSVSVAENGAAATPVAVDVRSLPPSAQNHAAHDCCRQWLPWRPH